MPFFDVTLEGPEVEWEFREAPEFYDAKGRPRSGKAGEAKKLVKPGIRVVTCEAESRDAAVALALTREASDGYVKVVDIEQRKT